jgi:hypothetical protein
MVALLCVGVWLWVRVEPQRALFDDETKAHPAEKLVV